MTFSMNSSSKSFKTITCLIIMLLLYSFFYPVGATAYAKRTGKEVLVFLAGAIVGGVVYDGAKWVFKWATSALTPYGQAAVLVTLAAAGISAFAVYMKNRNTVSHVTDARGCVYRNGHWACLQRMEAVETYTN